MTRLPDLRPTSLDPEQREIYDSITQGPRASGPQFFELTDPDGTLAGPFSGFLLTPRLGDALQALGAKIRFETSLSDRIREMAVLAVAAHWNSDFERRAHEAIGRSVGLTDAEIAALSGGELPDLTDELERICLRITADLLRGDISDQAWTGYAVHVDASTIFDLSTLVGYYSTLALQMRIFRI